MKINKIKNLACALVVAIICMFCLVMFSSCKDNLSKQSQNLTNYSLCLDFDSSSKVLSAKESVDYVNCYSVPLKSVEFHLYPNAFRKDAKIKPVSTLTFDKAYPNGFSEGKIDITKVSIGDNSNFKIAGSDQNILQVDLKEELYPDEKITIDIDFEVLLPNCNHRFGYGENTFNFGNFYPVACVYENGSFREDVYSSNGDPFYSQMANYDVTLTCDEDFVLASTGEQTKISSNLGKKSTQIKALAVRDFAFVLSKKFNVISQKAGDTLVNYYYYDDEFAQKSLQAGVDAINTFSNLFGQYPYSTFSVVKANFVHGGMEYPNLVYISDTVENVEDYTNVIVHETAHQWWYGLVGSDACFEAWQDEGLTEFSTLLFYKNNPTYNINIQESLNSSLSSYILFSEIYESVYGEFDSSMSRNLTDFKGDMDYTYVTYVKGVLFFDNLMSTIGEKNFLKGLKLYFKQNAYNIATKDDMIACFEIASKRNLESFFDSWLSGKVLLQNYK